MYMMSKYYNKKVKIVVDFILNYQIRIIKKLELYYYGGCEDLAPKIGPIFKIANLRLVSVYTLGGT